MEHAPGYAGLIGLVDLSSGQVDYRPTNIYSDNFLGGGGIGCKLYWQESVVGGEAFDSRSPLIFTTGPLGGFTGLAGSRWQVCGKSPVAAPQHFSYGNMGGSWGAYLKFAGFDGLVLKGEAEKPVYLFLHDGVCEIRNASHLWGKGTTHTQKVLKNELGAATRVMTIGPAGENRVTFATLLADDNASGSGGFGAVMGSKKLKAIAVSGRRRLIPAFPDELRRLANKLRGLKEDMDYEVPQAQPGLIARRKACYGCIAGCSRHLLEARDGRKSKYLCQNSDFYKERANHYYGRRNEGAFVANWLCDEYGLDTSAVEALILWLSRCHKAEIITDTSVGLPLSRIGSLEFIESLVRKISSREGFGEILASGISNAATFLGQRSRSLFGDTIYADGTVVGYCPRLYIVDGLFYVTEPRVPYSQLHEVTEPIWAWLDYVNKAEGAWVTSEVVKSIGRRFWGGEAAADFHTYEGKALAAKEIQDRQHLKGCLILCDFSWPTVEIEYFEPEILSQVIAAVTGRNLSLSELKRIGERVFNLQRAILIRDGHLGRQEDTLPDSWYSVPVKSSFLNADCLVPDHSGLPVSRKGEVVNRECFERMKDEYYELRGWDVSTGIQMAERLDKLGLNEIATELCSRGLAK